jgi:hypothetical protein
MSAQDETKARWVLSLWQGASEAHIRPDLSEIFSGYRGLSKQSPFDAFSENFW